MKIPPFACCLILAGLTLSQTGCDPRTSPSGAADEHDHDHSETGAHDHATGEQEQSARMAVAELQPTAGNEATGTVTFTQVDGGIQVNVDLTGLGAPGPRGFHIHESGDCSAPDGTSAGGHFNPGDAPHGAPDKEERHAGDFGNIEVDEEGNAQAEFIDSHISFSGDNSIIGRAVIVHAQEDDLETQPTGDAGARVACGVIMESKKQE